MQALNSLRDLTIVVQGTPVLVNRTLMISQSELLKRMITGPISTIREGKMTLEGTDPDWTKRILDYLQTGKWPEEESYAFEDLSQLWKTVDYFQLQKSRILDLEGMTARHISAENLDQASKLAQKYGLLFLETKCLAQKRNDFSLSRLLGGDKSAQRLAEIYQSAPDAETKRECVQVALSKLIEAVAANSKSDTQKLLPLVRHCVKADDPKLALLNETQLRQVIGYLSPDLEVVTIRETKMTSLDAFASRPKIKVLAISPIPFLRGLSELQSLEKLDLSGSVYLTKLDEVSTLKHLTEINLTDAFCTSDLTAGDYPLFDPLRQCPKLQKIYVSAHCPFIAGLKKNFGDKLIIKG